MNRATPEQWSLIAWASMSLVNAEAELGCQTNRGNHWMNGWQLGVVSMHKSGKRQIEGSKVLSLDRKARQHGGSPVDDLRGFACRVRWQLMLLLNSEETAGLVLTEFSAHS